jgi:FAD/FMN-containing dehydrogenase
MALPVSQVLDYRRRCDELLSDRGIRVTEYAIWTQPELFSMLLVPAGKTTDGSSENMAEAVDEVLTLAQDMGGTMEYCHGVGVKLTHLLRREMGVGFEVAKAIKRGLDPHDIMNPGKLF